MIFMNKNTLLILLAILIVAAGGTAYYFGMNDSNATEPNQEIMEQMDTTEQSEDEEEVSMSMEQSQEMLERMYDFEGELDDVTNGSDVRGINTEGNSSGTAKAVFDGMYYMTATFENLPTPVGTDFYEGWVVRMEPFDFISTGELEIMNGEYVNTYSSNTDYTDYDFYVLTLEPDDGDPAPADHIVEGTMFAK